MRDFLHDTGFIIIELTDLKTDFCKLIGIERRDAGFRGTKGLRRKTRFLHGIEFHMVRHDHLGPVGNQNLRLRNTAFLQGLEFFDEILHTQCHAVTDDVCDVIIKHAGRELVQRKFPIVVDDGMARIAAALKTNHNIGFRCLYIGNFPLTFVAPIGAHNCCYHK